jgi:hypothetical protein
MTDKGLECAIIDDGLVLAESEHCTSAGLGHLNNAQLRAR